MFKEASRRMEWKAALDIMFIRLRSVFIFDNVAVYLQDPRTKGVDVAFARAVGRGKSAEADAAWGEGTASQVITQQSIVLVEPGLESNESNRLKLAHLLGLPLQVGTSINGALVFIRFGGPSFTNDHKELAELLALWTSSLLEHRNLVEAMGELESVQRQMRLQDDFVSTISHELRTPLGFIKGYSTSLLRQDTVWDETTQREFLSIIDEEADRLNQLIDNLLESARLQSKTLAFKFTPLRLDALVRDVATRVKTHHPGLQVSFDMENVPSILGDSLRLTQVFENLFSNAVKYAPGAPLAISMASTGNKLKVIFADRGEGIVEDYLPFLFERFYRVPGEQSVTGTGLGLYICKQIILAHRGKIWAESILDQGTTFFIELPVEPLQ